MKWFKCDADLLDSPKIQALIAEHGFEGLGRWIAILTIVAKRMDSTDKCSVTYPLKTWAKLLSSRTGVLQEFVSSLIRVELLSDSCRIESDSSLTIHIPNLLKKRDEYSEKSRHAPKNVPSKSKDIRDKSKEIRDTPNGVSKARAAQAFAFVQIWNLEKLDSWPVINFEAMKEKPKKTLTDRILSASASEDFDLKQIIQKAKESQFLQTGRFFTLLWLVSLSTKYNELNYKQVLNGTYGNSATGNGKLQAQHGTHKLDPEFAKQLAEREKRKIVL